MAAMELMWQRARFIPYLAEVLTEPNESARHRALETLAGYGSQAANLAPTLVAALNDPEPWMRIRVALTLAAVDPGRKSEATAAITALLPHFSYPEALSAVCDALCRMGGSEVVAALLPLLWNPKVIAPVRIRVALTLAAVEPGRKGEAIAALVALLSDPEALSPADYRHTSVCDALRQLGEDPVPRLLTLLRQQTGEGRMPYLRALQAIGVDPEDSDDD
jgi:HEAT repeat protein